MFKFNKDIEYALISLVEMSRMPSGNLISARELSNRYAIPFKHLARILQKLSAEGIIQSQQGPKGGYSMVNKAVDIKLGRIIRSVRGDEQIADCLTEDGQCAQDDCGCNIKPFIQIFRDRWVDFVLNTTLEDCVQSSNETKKTSAMGISITGKE